MVEARSAAPPLSPMLVLGLASRALPPRPLDPALAVALLVLRRRHPDVFSRLDVLGQATFLIDPLDLPFAFLLRLGGSAPRLTCVRGADDVEGTPRAVIRGSLPMLIDLLEGRLDGDAAFFSRALTIEGDTEAVLTLRNAIDSSEIRVIEDLLAALGPLSPPARWTFDIANTAYRRAASDLEMLRAAFVGPLAARVRSQASDINRLESEFEDVRRSARRRRPVGGDST